MEFLNNTELSGKSYFVNHIHSVKFLRKRAYWIHERYILKREPYQLLNKYIYIYIYIHIYKYIHMYTYIYICIQRKVEQKLLTCINISAFK